MAAAEPDAELLTTPAARSKLGSRITVGLFLLVVAVADIWVGGPAFTAMILAGVGLVFWEWSVMHRTPRRWRAGGLLVILLCGLLAHVGAAGPGLLLLAGAILLFLLLSLGLPVAGRRWISTGLLYAGLPAVALIWLRREPDGFHLVLWTMGVVWATDTFAYFAGRAIGGPKLWPAISPNKTWAGLVGGALGAALFALAYGHWAAGWASPVSLFLIGAVLACAAQAGDLFESWLKRRAGVKDSGRLLGSHGGIMDRVDGLVPVACLVAGWLAIGGPAMQAAP